MKLPWVKRAEELHEDTIKAEQQLLAVKKRWPQIKQFSHLITVKANPNEVSTINR